jgi:hypothetical protein
MARPIGRLLRENIFLVAAAALPLLVVVFFVLASAIPRWTVPPPAYDVVVRAIDAYSANVPRTNVEFTVRDQKVHAIVRPVPANGYGSRARLFLFDHATLSSREVRVELPADLDTLKEGDPPRIIPVDALSNRRVLDQIKAPDGYQFEHRSGRSAGVVGELFGMHRYDAQAALVNRGRVIPLALPPGPYNYYPPLDVIGWLEPYPTATAGR